VNALVTLALNPGSSARVRKSACCKVMRTSETGH
jgi:hypothetical protein